MPYPTLARLFKPGVNCGHLVLEIEHRVLNFQINSIE
jgi:hypothetical protein